ncbi:S4 domain-containing protein [Brevundimonas sp.]|uniref:S4 domain-containing protein n=1 Tax=Brevundimonas sp. TaxID=1871086 RepID=UPI001D1D3979|nr:S4 domain-containing protein [Brevundimonas sp.]MBL0948907.1 RNA-binding S4 domain-containing protein [Brevundimonas sp.]
MTDSADVCRLDVWLWRARFAPTRSEAAARVEAGRIRLTRAGIQTRMSKPGFRVRTGDVLMLMRGPELVEVRILALGKRRGPPAEAAALYEDLNRPPLASPDG